MTEAEFRAFVAQQMILHKDNPQALQTYSQCFATLLLVATLERVVTQLASNANVAVVP